MLASTVQFSTNKQPPPRRPHPTRTPQGDRRCETRDGPARRSPRNRNRFRVPLPQDPTACLRPRTPPPPPFHAPEGAVLGAGRTPAAELVSVPPSSTTQTT